MCNHYSVTKPKAAIHELALETWTNVPWEIARDPQRPPPAGALKVVTVGLKEDLG